jgi:hypothetical protein
MRGVVVRAHSALKNSRLTGRTGFFDVFLAKHENLAMSPRRVRVKKGVPLSSIPVVEATSPGENFPNSPR